MSKDDILRQLRRLKADIEDIESKAGELDGKAADVGDEINGLAEDALTKLRRISREVKELEEAD